jgi:ribonuclease III
MIRRGKAKSVVASQEPPAAEAARQAPGAGTTDGQKDSRRRRRRGDGSLEERIGYRFKDAALLDSALSHISSLKGARNRAGSYQRLEFLGDHVLGLVISDMLFRAFPKADEGELSRRLADLVRKETCADSAPPFGSARRRPMPAAASGPRSWPMCVKH